MSNTALGERKPAFVRLNGVITALEQAALALAAACVIAVILITAADVFGRYVLNRSIGGAYDGALVLMVGLCFLSAAAVQNRNGHVAVHFVHRLLPRGARRMLAVLQLACAAVLMGLIAWMNARYAIDAWRAGWVYGGFGVIPTWLPYSFIGFGCLLMMFRTIFQIVAVIADDRSAARNVDPEDEGINS